MSEQVVTYKPHMVSLLRRMQSARAVITLTINNNDTLYNSMVIDVCSESETLYLDEVNSASGHRKIKKGTIIHFDGRLKGVRIQFSTRIDAVEADNSIALYRLPLPNKMVYWQRRRHYRAQVHKEPLAIRLPLPFKQTFTGKIIDISASGVCTRLDYPASAILEAEQSIHDATITLPGRNNITCDIEVKSVRHYPEEGYSLIGTEFTDIGPHQLNHVERIVAMLDRNQRRAAS